MEVRTSLSNPLRHQTWLPIVVVAAGVLLTILLYQTLEQRERELAQMRFEALAEEHLQTIESRVLEAFEAVHLLAGFYQGAERVSWQDFQLYSLSLIDRRPGLRSMLWAVRVPDADRAEFEAAVLPIGSEPFHIKTLTPRGTLVRAEREDLYFPVTFIKPFEPHQPLWGVDLLSQPDTRAAIRQAQDTGDVAATAPVVLYSEREAIRSIWAFRAIYEEAVDDDVDFAVDAPPVRSVVAGVYHPRELIDAVVPRFARRNMVFEIRDAAAAPPGDMIYRSSTPNDAQRAGNRASNDNGDVDDEDEPAAASWRLAKTADLAREDLAWIDNDDVLDPADRGRAPSPYRAELEIAGRRWVVTAMPTNAFMQQHRTWAPQAVLGGGLLVTLLLGLYLGNTLTRAQQVEAQVAERTSELREMATALRRSNQALEEFAYIASHDLQEPLRKVHGFGEMLADEAGDALNEEQRDYLRRMQNAATRMQALITGLLTYSRIATKSQPLEPVDLNEIGRQVREDLEMRVRETGGHVEIDELPTIEADPIQMRQLLQNLISNGLKFHRPDVPPAVEVRGELIGGERCRIEVRDNGIGFERDEADRIFKPFQRLHGRDTYDGTGMGLPVCKKIVERHGGSITARSKPGEGATFTVILPCRHHYRERGYGWPSTGARDDSDGR